MVDVSEHGPNCPLRVDRPIMIQRWETLTFVHWSFDPDAVARLLPAALTVETFEGRAWVGLIPFFMRVRGPRGPSVPWASRFCETNVRTYVRDDQGRSGIWFFSLDAARLGAVITARATFRLPYLWSRMRVRRTSDTVEYTTRRRWPGPHGASSRLVVEVGAAFSPAELTARDHFLTARWRLFSIGGGRGDGWRRYAEAQHDPWPLRRARVLDCDDELLAAAGLPKVETEPLAHFSPGVDVRIGLPHRLD
jgi:uncharacterized protein YqjF (DUF2071 family)